MSHTPLLSVVLTVYNAGAFLAEAIDSVLTQTYRDFEFLILDDGSTDNSTEIIHNKMAMDARIRYYKNDTNCGLAKGKNKIIGLAKGKLIAVADGDDMNVPTRLEKQVKMFLENPGIHVLGSAVYLVNNKDKVCGTWHYPETDAEIKREFTRASMIAHPTSMFRREVFETLGGYNEQLAVSEDWDFFYRATSHFNFANLAEPLVYYRFHDNNSSLKGLPDIVLYALSVKKELPASAFKNGLTELLKLHPQHRTDACLYINRFYTFNIDTFLRLEYPHLSRGLYQQVKQNFFPFFDRASKKIFIKSVILIYLKNRRFKPVLSLLSDYLFIN